MLLINNLTSANSFHLVRERWTAYGEKDAYRGGRLRDLEMKSAATSSSRATRCSILGGSSCKGHGRSRSYAGYGVVVGASTAAAVDTAAPAARCVEGESGERQRGALWVVRREEKERARGTREGGRKWRCHSCGRSQATVAAGFGIGVSGRRRREELRFWAFWGWDVLTAFVGLLLHRAQIR
jgi:hypothetical protein